VVTESAVITTTESVLTTAPMTMTSTTLIPTTDSVGNLVTLTSVVTVVGQTTYVTVEVKTISPTGAGLNNASQQDNATGFFSNTGAVAGTFLAVGIALAAFILAGLWFVRRKKRQRALDEDLRVAAGGAGDGGAGTSRFHDDEDEEEFESSTGAHGAYKGAPMTQYNQSMALPLGAAYPASASYYDSTPTAVSGQPSSSSSHNMLGAGAAAAAAGAAGAGAYGGMVASSNRHSLQSAPSYYGGHDRNASYSSAQMPGQGGPNQAYNDQYAVASQYTSAGYDNRPYDDWGGLYQPQQPSPTERMSNDQQGSSDGSRESGGLARRDSASNLMMNHPDQNYSDGSLPPEEDNADARRRLRVANPTEDY